MPRPRRNFQPHLLYHVVQRGNKGQWVFLDDEDFAFSLALLRKKAPHYGVVVHDYCLTYSQGHWLLQGRTKTGISCLMRDMQSQTSKYLNRKYKHRPWKLFVPLGTDDHTGKKWWRQQANPLKNGVNWAQRFYATALELHYRKSILKYIDDGPVRAGVCTQAEVYRWSGAGAHMNGMESLSLILMDKGVQPGPTIGDYSNPTPAPLLLGLDIATAFQEASRRRIAFHRVLARIRLKRSVEHSSRSEPAFASGIDRNGRTACAPGACPPLAGPP